MEVWLRVLRPDIKRQTRSHIDKQMNRLFDTTYFDSTQNTNLRKCNGLFYGVYYSFRIWPLDFVYVFTSGKKGVECEGLVLAHIIYRYPPCDKIMRRNIELLFKFRYFNVFLFYTQYYRDTMKYYECIQNIMEMIANYGGKYFVLWLLRNHSERYFNTCFREKTMN